MKSSRSHLLSKSKSHRTFRMAKGLMGAAFAGIFMLGSGSSAMAERSLSGIKVDTSALGANATAREIKTNLEERLRYYFAGDLRGERSAPLLVVRLTSVTVQTTPEFGGMGGNGGDTDYLEGEALIVGKGGLILQRHPLLTALSSTEGGWYLPDYDKRRADALSNSYAYWLKQQLPLQ